MRRSELLLGELRQARRSRTHCRAQTQWSAMELQPNSALLRQYPSEKGGFPLIVRRGLQPNLSPERRGGHAPRPRIRCHEGVSQ